MTSDAMENVSSRRSAHLDVAFRSGMTNRADLRGAINAGAPVGVVIGQLTTAQLVAIIPNYLRDGGLVFADSGAFSAAMSGHEMDWSDIMGRYSSLSLLSDRRENLYLVAPDVVGDQDATLKLLEAWSSQMRLLIEDGCRVIVPLQCGTLSGQEMIEAATRILRSRNFVAGIPSNRAAMPTDECAALSHHAFHILGRVQIDAEQHQRIQALRRQNPCAIVTADANWLRSRMDRVRQMTEQERDRRRRRPETMPMDHPRSIAIEHAIRRDPHWGHISQLATGRQRHPVCAE